MESTEKTCADCKRTRPIEDFPTYRSRPGGRLLFRNVCKSCYNARSRDWRRNTWHCPRCKRYRPRRKFYVSQGMEAVICQDCRDAPPKDEQLVREEYEFAVTALGMSRSAAANWVREQFGLSERTVERYRLTAAEVPDPEPADVELRKCKVCGRLKTLDQMSRSVHRSRVYYYRCKRCYADRAKVRRHKKAAEEGRTLRQRRVRNI
jgi:hypothetical protein